MNERELNPDEAIDRMLSGLRGTGCPPGMRSRILIAAKERAALRRSSYYVSPLRIAAWTVAGVTMVAVAFALPWRTLMHHSEGSRSEEVRSHDIFPTPPIQHTPVGELGPPQPRSVRHFVRAPAERKPPKAKSLSDEDTLALTEMNAPSHPAPPMPLTDQETLFIRLMHKGDPVELAMLDPEIRSSQEISARADFERFFKQAPKIVEIKSPLNIKLLKGDEK